MFWADWRKQPFKNEVEKFSDQQKKIMITKFDLNWHRVFENADLNKKSHKKGSN